MNIKRSSLLSSASLALTVVAASAANQVHAQVLEEIVVTAEKRETTLQETPIAIAAVDGDTLQRQNINQLFDLDRIVPELEIFSGAGTLSVISIRGVDAGNWDPASESPTVVNVDGAVLMRNGGLEGHFYDLERVEVLKGPQGTLYGRGAAAGLVNIITRKPSTEAFGWRGEVEAGDYDLVRTEGAVNVPLGDDWAIRAAFRNIERDGYYTSGFEDSDTRSARVSIAGTPSERASLLITLDSQERGGLPNGTFGSGAHYIGGYGNVTLDNPPPVPFDDEAIFRISADNSQVKNESWGAMVQFDYEFDSANMTIQYSHRDLLEDQLTPFGTASAFLPSSPPPFTSGMLVPVPTLFGPNGWTTAVYDHDLDHDSDSIEVRLNGETDSLSWIAGLYGYDDTTQHSVFGSFLNYNIDPITTQSYAAFGQVTWMLTESLEVTAGLRYTDDKKGHEVSNLDADIFGYTEGSWSETTERINLTYRLSDNNMLYGNVSTGYKAGTISTTQFLVQPETLTAFELGSKNEFLDNTLQANFEYYYYDYDNYVNFFNAQFCNVYMPDGMTCVDTDGDMAITQADTTTISSTISPGGAEQYGLSAGLMWLASENDLLSFNINYQNNEYGDRDVTAAVREQFPTAINAASAGDTTGRRFGPAPWRANASYTHTFNLGNSGTLDLTGDLFYEGQAIDSEMQINTPSEYSLPGRDAYVLGNLTVRYTAPSGQWYVRAWVNNISDAQDLATKDYTDIVFGAPVFPPMSGYITGRYVLPRTWGLTLGADF